MPLHFNPLFFGAILVVALGTAVYHVFTSQNQNYSNTHYEEPRTTYFAGGYDTKRNNTDEENERLKKRKQCSICLNELKKNLRQLSCKHLFHEHCIQSWFNVNGYKTCPNCRQLTR